MNGLQKFCLSLVGILMMGLSANGQAQTVVEYIHTDALGTPVAVTDAGGNIIERSEYDPYGKLLNRPLTDGPGFTGHVQDAATGLVYMQQRYYETDVGRTLSVDPVTAYSNPVGAFNRYWYANNNPYKFTDPDGRVPRGYADLCRLWCDSSYVADGRGGQNSTSSESKAQPTSIDGINQRAWNQLAAMGDGDSDWYGGNQVIKVQNPIFSFPGNPPVRGLILSNYAFEMHIKSRHRFNSEYRDKGRFYRSILNQTTSQESFSRFLQMALNTGVPSIQPYPSKDEGAMRIYVDLAMPIGTTPSGRPSSTLVIGVTPAGTFGQWRVETIFPFGM